MKTFKFLFAFFIISCFFSSMVNAQAIVEKDNEIVLYTYEGAYPSYDQHQVITPDGSVNYRVSFKVSLDDLLIIQAILYGNVIFPKNSYNKKCRKSLNL
nr:hypothetical protein [Draconibacterium sp.]